MFQLLIKFDLYVSCDKNKTPDVEDVISNSKGS